MRGSQRGKGEARRRVGGGTCHRKAPPTESAFAKNARPLRLPLKGGVVPLSSPGKPSFINQARPRISAQLPYYQKSLPALSCARRGGAWPASDGIDYQERELSHGIRRWSEREDDDFGRTRADSFELPLSGEFRHPLQKREPALLALVRLFRKGD